MTSELRDAVDGLYAAFARYARLPPPPFQETNDQSGWADVLGAKPLRQLTPTDLERLARKAMTTWGTADDFRHYLPRLFDLAAAPAVQSTVYPGCDTLWLGNYIGDTEFEVLFGKLDYGHWRTWPAAEQAAVTVYLRSLWRDVCQTDPSPFNVGSCLCAIAQAADDLSPYLADWRPDRSRGEAMRFAAFLDDALTWDEWRRVLTGAWWRGRGEQRRQAAEWLLSGDRAAELERAFFAFGIDDATAAALSAAADRLAALRRAAGAA